MKVPPAYVGLKDVFTEEELDRIVSYGDQQPTQPATVSLQHQYATSRRTSIAWLGEETWIHERIRQVFTSVNQTYYHFDLDGSLEPLQYSVYGVGDHFGWHLDLNPTAPRVRKLSLSVQLTEPSEYDGGVLQVQIDATPRPMLNARGSVIVFPSFILHQVEPVTRGIRKALIAWAGGPAFR